MVLPLVGCSSRKGLLVYPNYDIVKTDSCVMRQFTCSKTKKNTYIYVKANTCRCGSLLWVGIPSYHLLPPFPFVFVDCQACRHCVNTAFGLIPCGPKQNDRPRRDVSIDAPL